MTSTELQLPIEFDVLLTILKKHGVTSASVFGSYARGEARPDSDLDLLISLAPDRSLFDLGSLQYELEEVTNCSVDVTTKLHPRFEPYITPDLVEIL